MLALLVLASVFVQNFWCRYLCPYGALMGLAALASPLRIRREASLCIDCAKCAKACPSALPVDRLVAIRLGRMHGMPGVRGRVPGGGRAADGGAAEEARSGVGDGRRCRGAVPGGLRICPVDRPLAHGPAQPRCTSN